MSTWANIIDESFQDLGVIRPGESVSATVQADAFTRLQDFIASLSAEGATVFTETLQTFTATLGTANYTLGVGGSWSTALRAQKVVAWKASSGVYVSGGKALSFDEFDAAAQAAGISFAQAAAQVAADEAALAAKVQAAMAQFFQAPAFTFPSIALSSANVPFVLGADSAYPLANVRIFPAVGASVEVTYWTPITAPAAVGDTVSLPPGWNRMVRTNFAMDLLPRYGRQGFDATSLAANAQSSKAVIIAQNAMDSATVTK